MTNQPEEPLLFAGSSHPELAKEIALEAGITLGALDLTPFPDGELFCQIKQNVRGREVFVLQSVARRPNHYLVELLLIVDAVKRAAARNIVVILPYFGYSRQDRRDRPRVPITARLIADLLEAAGAKQVITMDPHAEQLQGFFNIPVESLYARPKLADVVCPQMDKEFVVAAPDMGSVKLARGFATDLGVDLAIVDKERQGPTKVKIQEVIGNINGKDVLLADDMCTTASTLVSAAKACHEKGASRTFAAITHGLFVGDAIARIEASPLEALITSNTIPLSPQAEGCYKIKLTSVASQFGQAINCILSGRSISSLYHTNA